MRLLKLKFNWYLFNSMPFLFNLLYINKHHV